MLALTPEQVAPRTHLRLVDIRPSRERDDGIGMVPGSIGLDPKPDLARFVEQVEKVSRGLPVVFVCTSGERARTWAIDAAAMLPSDLGYMAGGVLAWGAAGLPLCARELPIAEQALSPTDFTRRLASCFVGELAEVSLDRDIDPMEMLRTCFRHAEADFDGPTRDGLRRVLDHAAALSRELGTESTRIAANIDLMLPLLPDP